MDSSIYCNGPSVLLINRERFLKFLESKGYGVIWITFGEKNMIGGRIDECEGRLEISGVYKFVNDKVTGKIITQFIM